MHIDILEALAGALVGFTVGLTGMGGGALMTPLLILLFGISPGTAVSSDLLTSLIMKPVGGTVHLRQGTVDWGLVRWLVLGSVPAAFSGVLVLRALGKGSALQNDIQRLLGVALVVAAVAMIAKALLAVRERGRRTTAPDRVEVKRVATLLIGMAGGFIVGMTSVGSGSLMMVMLLVLYPSLTTKRLVGTDLVQAIPLVAAATAGHALFGSISLGLTGSLLIGSLPGVYLGARVSSRAPEAVVRPALIVILLASALKLLGLQTSTLAWTMLVFAVVAAPLWGAVEASLRPDEEWTVARRNRTTWVAGQAIGAPFGIGLVFAGLYAFRTRPALEGVRQRATASAAGSGGSVSGRAQVWDGLGPSPSISNPTSSA